MLVPYVVKVTGGVESMPDWYCAGPLTTGGQRDTEAKLTAIQAGRAL